VSFLGVLQLKDMLYRDKYMPEHIYMVLYFANSALAC
jgi:hypothetical protein